MATRFFISSHRNCRRFLAVTHHAAILNNYSHDLQALHFTVERGGEDATSVSGIQNPGLADLLSRHVEENEQVRTRRYVPYWTITDQDTLEQHPALHRSFTNQAAA